MSTTGTPRRFELHREADFLGAGDTGHIADGVEWTNGNVTLFWRGEFPRTEDFQHGMAGVMQTHVNSSKTTRIIWLDESAADARILSEIRAMISEGSFMESLRFVKWVNSSNARDVVLACQLDEVTLRVFRDLLRFGGAVYPDDYLVVGSNGLIRVAAMEPFENTYEIVEEELTPEEEMRRRTWRVEYLTVDDETVKHARKVAAPHYNSEDGVRQWYLENGASEVITVVPFYGRAG